MRSTLWCWLGSLALGLGALTAHGGSLPEPDRSFRAERQEAQQAGAARTWRFPRERLTREEALLSRESAEVVRGVWDSALWAYPRGTDPARAFEDLLSQWNGTSRFRCSGRGCGESAIFAHEVFGVADLYGRDGEQHYVLLTAEGGVGALYVSQRGTREVFAQLLWVTASEALPASLPSPLESAAALGPEGRLRLVGEAEVLQEWMMAFGEARGASDAGLVLLVHRQGGAEALSLTEALAQRLEAALAPEVVRAYGVGGAIPGRGSEAFEVELWEVTP